MRLAATNLLSVLGASLLLFTGACGDDGGGGSGSDTGTGTGDETGSPTTTGDGDGDPTTTGDGDGDGDPTTTTGDGDGDGDPTTTGDGDGDGDPTTTGDGDGDPTTTGDGDGDANLDCFDFNEADCGADPTCQAVVGQPLKQNGPNSPCLEPSEFLGCIPASGCGDAETWFCAQNNKWLVPDTCGPDGADMCDAPMEPVADCP